MNFNDYIMPELLILVPVLYLIGVAIKKSEFKDKYIPFVLGIISIALCLLWEVSNAPMTTTAETMTVVFTAITQGILIAGASVYAHELVTQAKKEE